MYEFRWASTSELPVLADLWFKMACEMGESDGLPKPDEERLEEVKKLFINEDENGQLSFRVATDVEGEVVACAGGLLRMEYAFPLSEEQTPFGWIVGVYTDEEHRKNGLATQLVEDVCSWLKDKGAKRARLWASASARNMYEEIGFKAMLDMEKPL